MILLTAMSGLIGVTGANFTLPTYDARKERLDWEAKNLQKEGSLRDQINKRKATLRQEIKAIKRLPKKKRDLAKLKKLEEIYNRIRGKTYDKCC